jgi:hypothetical protein
METIIQIAIKRTLLGQFFERIGLLKPLTAEVVVATKSITNLSNIKVTFSDWEKISHTIQLKNVPVEPKSFTREDFFDCYVRAFLSSSVTQEYLDNFSDCWIYNEGEAPKPSQFLLDKLAANDPSYLSAKPELNTHTSADLYLIKYPPDPQAVFQNLIREIEKVKGVTEAAIPSIVFTGAFCNTFEGKLEENLSL